MSTLHGLVGSLTSEFIPAGTCISQGIQVVRYISDQTQGYNYYLTAGPGVSTCFPSSQFPFEGSYYSPGRCPSGYSAACTLTGGNSMGNAIETTVTCCPMMPYRFECNTNAVGSDWGVFADCTTSTSTLEVGLDVIGAVPTSKLVGSSRDASGNPILTHAVINGYGIQVRWQQTDEALLFGITTPSTLSSTTTLGSSPPTMTAKTASSSHPNSGTIAGIAVGAVAGILILLGIVILIVRSKRKRIPEVANRESPGHSIDYNTENGPPTVELSGLDSDPIIVFPKYELPIPAPTAVIPRQELPVQAQRDTVHTAQRHSPEDQGDSWGRAHRAYSNPRELEAMERPGELEVGLHIAELADTDRRGQNYHS